MKTDAILRTRRDFLRSTILGGAFAYTAPAFLANTFSALEAEAANSATQAVTGRDGTILVVLQMAGGNDGINTVVPFADDNYHRARPHLGLAANDVLKLTDSVGLHPSLTGFKGLYDSGNLAVIQGIGYPNPNRSHFRSTEIWQTASDSAEFERYGWLGRYFDNACAGCDPTVGINIGRQMPQAFAAKNPMGVSLENPQGYRFISNEKGASNGEQSYRKLNELDDPAMMESSSGAESNSGDTIGAIHGPTPHTGSALDFLERTAMDAQLSSDKIRAISAKIDNKGNYPQSQLANSLKLVARLIGGGLPTRVFYVSQGGYDTHTNQLPAQQRLLKDLGDSLKAFTDDMKAQGNMSRVVVMTFSEFGRRVAENANGGTDHGAAAPMFIVGEKVKAGLLGKYPSLAPGDLFEGDIKYNVDFRSVYAGLLESWLKTPSAPILGRQFTPLICT
ncbi:MAG TPA: DUF1501 domain-containing protein [Verrucomicrobiae bacterium]|jgi:uncharacterized protein (DUF1501 family)|nr:DUF1501 domain-containing protein [Verrucomicrobiae bacterium]